MLKQYKTTNGIFNVLSSDIAFECCFQNGSTWDDALIKHVLSFIPEEGIILDIGGHIGTHAIPYSLRRPTSKIISFEPQTRIRKLLELNKYENNVDNLEIMPYGLGHTTMSVNLAHDFISDGYPKEITVDYEATHDMNFGGLGITNDPRGEQIEIRTVDSLGLQNITYMKIDVEGAETLVVYGAQNTIRLCKPVLMIEQSDKNLTPLYENTFPELKNFSVTEFLNSLGYIKTDLGDANYLYRHIIVK